MQERADLVEGVPPISGAEFEQVRRFIYTEAGIDLGPTKRAMVQSRLAKRLHATDCKTFHGYLKFLATKEGAGERQIAINLLTTNETYFFREPQHFDWLKQHVSELARQRGPQGNIRIWSAACSTGEEPYTIAMILAETLGLRYNWSIHATDINTKVTEFAKRAIYIIERVNKTPKHLWMRYFRKGFDEYEGKVRVHGDLIKRVTFSNANLLDLNAFAEFEFDIVFLRNVMIYFDDPTKSKVLNGVIRHMNKEGYLLISHSEVIRRPDVPLKQEATSRYRINH
ncbi:SAM-dependent methyltransferase [Burkholderiaceae bacterium DAT-1]|nr:SAM-dependent methyltransferase [Burkholderiaceae bacterium DAT-1]